MVDAVNSGELARRAHQMSDHEDQRIAADDDHGVGCELQLGYVDHTEDVVSVVQTPVITADTEVPHLPGPKVLGSDAESAYRKREMCGGRVQVTRLEHRVGERVRLDTVVDPLSQPPTDPDLWTEEHVAAAESRAERWWASYAHGRDPHRHKAMIDDTSLTWDEFQSSYSRIHAQITSPFDAGGAAARFPDGIHHGQARPFGARWTCVHRRRGDRSKRGGEVQSPIGRALG
ncbi:hypothetical protein [Embleya sp. NPDC020886]|uniref:hypothetical protein n=1 Tax=Embleya sp. NPDC020886 TaxID=3363980 RepID=UPI00379394C1